MTEISAAAFIELAAGRGGLRRTNDPITEWPELVERAEDDQDHFTLSGISFDDRAPSSYVRRDSVEVSRSGRLGLRYGAGQVCPASHSSLGSNASRRDCQRSHLEDERLARKGRPYAPGHSEKDSRGQRRR